jgi:hypothetical protein
MDMSSATLVSVCCIVTALAGLAISGPIGRTGVDIFLLLGVVGTGLLLVELEATAPSAMTPSDDRDEPR